MSEIGPHIVIVGGTSGIGLATARLFAARRARVTIVGREPEKFAAALAPIARPGAVDEVADAIAFLVGNRFVTGVVLDVDGGLHLT